MSNMPSVVASAAMTSNWIPDLNPHHLPKPPAWFLKILWDHDAGLVVLPSRQVRRYVLARRRERSKLVANVLERVEQQSGPSLCSGSDAEMLKRYKLVKVDGINCVHGNYHAASWMTSTPGLLSDLRSRDMWAAGGFEKYHAQLLADEKQAEDTKRAEMLDSIDHRARDAYRSYQARTGQRNQRATSGTQAKFVSVGTL